MSTTFPSTACSRSRSSARPSPTPSCAASTRARPRPCPVSSACSPPPRSAPSRVMPMEGNAIAVVPGDIDGGDDYDVTVYLSTQMPHLFADLASKSFGIQRERIRVIAPHVGGGFGAKAGLASEHVSAIAIARLLN